MELAVQNYSGGADNALRYDWKHERGSSSIIALEFWVDATPSCDVDQLSSRLRARFRRLAREVLPRYEQEPQCTVLSIRVSESTPNRDSTRSQLPQEQDSPRVENSGDLASNGREQSRLGGGARDQSRIAEHDDMVQGEPEPTGDEDSVQTSNDELMVDVDADADAVDGARQRAPRVSKRCRELQQGLYERIRDGAMNFLSRPESRLDWDDSVELLKPEPNNLTLHIFRNRLRNYNHALGFRKWLCDFLISCAKVCERGDTPTRQSLLTQRKFLYCVLEPINLLYPTIGNDAFHVITALGAALRPLAKTSIKSCSWDEVETAVSNLVPQLLEDKSWSKLGSRHLVDIMGFLEGPQLSRDEVKTLLGLEVSLTVSTNVGLPDSPDGGQNMFVPEYGNQGSANLQDETTSNARTSDRNTAREQSEAASQVEWDLFFDFEGRQG